LRRGYNFADGSDGLGRMDAGLFFIAFVRDPASQFVPLQTVLARDDAMSEYLLHTGSGLFAVPPGARTGGETVGAGLLAGIREGGGSGASSPMSAPTTRSPAAPKSVCRSRPSRSTSSVDGVPCSW